MPEMVACDQPGRDVKVQSQGSGFASRPAGRSPKFIAVGSRNAMRDQC